MVIHTERSSSALKTNLREFTQKAGAAAPKEARWYASWWWCSRCSPVSSLSIWLPHSQDGGCVIGEKFTEVLVQSADHRDDLLSSHVLQNFTPRRLQEIHTETKAGNWRTKAAPKSQCEWGYCLWKLVLKPSWHRLQWTSVRTASASMLMISIFTDGYHLTLPDACCVRISINPSSSSTLERMCRCCSNVLWIACVQQKEEQDWKC